MNKNTSVIMAAAVAVAGILTLAILAIATQQQAFAQAYNQGSSYDNNNQQPQCCEKQQPQPEPEPQCCEKQQQPSSQVAKGGNGGSGGAGGAGGEGGQGGTNTVNNAGMKGSYQDTSLVMGSGSGTHNNSSNQTANGDANGGNANGGDAST